MKIILQEDLRGVGKKGAAVKVKDGFARNFLLPNGLALKVTPANLAFIERKIKTEAGRSYDEKKKAEELAARFLSVSCTVSVDTHDDDKLYGSITAAHIAGALEAEGIILDKKQILLGEPLKALGIYNIEVKLHPEVKAMLKVWVVKGK
ncbi:MAG: 50S ribosomal protein L9 [Candidatus Omnitrophota bacterium]|nr:50S ribosomal protein L9 [Candidatus Omnitrophota bacterium]